MLRINIFPGENIDRAIKRYRNKIRKTQQMKQLRENQHFTKKSISKREERIKAIYRQNYLRERES